MFGLHEIPLTYPYIQLTKNLHVADLNQYVLIHRLLEEEFQKREELEKLKQQQEDLLKAEREQKAVLQSDREEQERLLSEAKEKLEQLERDKKAAAEQMQVIF